MKAFINLFEQRVRGVRLVEVIGFSLAIIMVFWVALSKAREGEDIRRMNELDGQIAEQKAVVGALKIKVAQLERPERLEDLAKAYLNMQPVSSSHEADIDSIGEISRATSQAVREPTVPPPPPPPTADELITTVDHVPATPKPVHP